MFSRLAKLYDQATGGARVAADPNNPLDDFWPRTLDAAGVNLAEHWFEIAKENKEQVFYFLVGGPGGGKSHVSSRLVSELNEVSVRHGGLAHRSHLYSYGESQLLLVNDATISDDQGTSSSLATEISECLATGRSLIACVNRGILIEELAFQTDDADQAAEVLRWIAGIKASDATASITTSSSSDYLKLGLLEMPSLGKVKLCVSYVDVCSLFEKRPNIAGDLSDPGSGLEQVNMPDYRLTKLAKRAGLKTEDVSGNDLVHKAVLATLGDGSWEGADPEVNPIEANLRNLSDERLIGSLGTIIRSAEIYSGQRFTYREIWGLIARAIIGDLATQANSKDLMAKLADLQPRDGDPAIRFRNIQRLSEYRFHQSLFAVRNGKTIAESPNSNPITKLLALVDPIRDSQLGTFDPDSEGSGWVTPILDAFSSSYAAGSPLESVLAQVGKNPKDLFPISVTKFEHQLDEAFLGLMADSTMKDWERTEVVRWYSTYLSRLYAVSNGISAFRGHVGSWIQAWLAAPTIPAGLENQLLTLLRPRRSGTQDENSYIPIFESRTTSITSAVTQPKLAARLNDVKISSRRSGDSIILNLREHGQDVADLLLDFSILRDALVCTGDDVGVSDMSAVNTPRLERLRAARLTPAMMTKAAPLSILHGLQVEQVVLSDD